MNEIQKIATGVVSVPDKGQLLDLARNDVLDRADVGEVLGKLSDTLALAADLVVNSDAAQAEGVQRIGELRRHAKSLDAIRQTVVGAPTAVIGAYNAVFRECSSGATEGEAELSTKLNLYAAEKRRKANEEAAKAAAERKAAEDAARAAAEAASWAATEAEAVSMAAEAEGASAAVVVAAKVEAQATHQAKAVEPVAAASATAQSKVVHVFHEVENIAQVPREYVAIDVKAINRALARGARVPGITTREDVSVKVRSR